MNRHLLSPSLSDKLCPSKITPLVAYLCRRGCHASGGLYEAAAGHFRKVRWQHSQGIDLSHIESMTDEVISDHWKDIENFDNPFYTNDMMDCLNSMTNKTNND